MKAVVIGGGVGGLAAAIGLARAGAAVEVVEAALELAEAGAGLQLSPNAVKALRAIGAEERVAAAATRPPKLELRLGKSGQRIFSIPMGRKADRRHGAPYLHIHRADLQRALADELKAAAPHALNLGRRAVAVSTDGRVMLEGGQELTADLIVAADGIHSMARRTLHPNATPRFTGCVAWRATVEASRVSPAPPDGAVVWTGEKCHVVTYRLRGGTMINFVGVVEQDGWRKESWSEPGEVHEMRRLFAGFAPPVQAVLRAAETCARWALFDRDPLPSWVQGRLALLGDAAHPMPPFQAQGAAMALEDAAVLVRCLRDGPDIETALRRYEKERMARTAQVLESARANRKRFHQGGRLFAYGPMWTADRLLPFVVHGAQDWLYRFDVTRAPRGLD